MTTVTLFVIPYFLLFILGAVVGSFLNVVGLRYRAGVGLGGRSFCLVCRRSLHWYELVPLISFLSLRGKCLECRAPISWQYPLVEAASGLVFASLYGVYGLRMPFLLAVATFCIYIVVVIYDARHKVIPDELAYAAFALAVLYRLLIAGTAFDWFAGPLLFVIFWCIWRYSHGRAMGLGDGKLALSLGTLLGLAEGLSALALAFWIGAAVSVLYMIFSRKGLTMKSEVPFAPFLVLGAWLALVLHANFFHI